MTPFGLSSVRASLIFCAGFALLACPAGDDSASEGGESSSSTSTTGPTGPTSLSASSTAPTTMTTMADTGTSTSAGSDSTTAGMGICEVDLPPSPPCMAGAAIPPPEMLPGDRHAPGMNPAPAGEPGDATDPGFGGFLQRPDGPVGDECGIFEQDCPAGEKCMPWANDGGSSWNATRCTTVVASPDQVGDECTVEGSGTSGFDSCDLGAMCWGVDAKTNIGVCVEMCGCTELTPTCDTPNTACSISNGGVIALCLGVCNPLDPDACDAGEGCYASGSLFQCANDASGELGTPGDPCEFLNVCDPGSYCGMPSFVPGGCGGSTGCCTALCDPSDGPEQCLAGQSCVPFYDEGGAPDECLGQVGVCVAD